MKSAACLVLLVLGVVAAQENKVCSSNADCGAGACCVRHRYRYVPPSCQASRQVNQTCRQAPIVVKNAKISMSPVSDEHVFLADGYLDLCPCAEGLQCEAIFDDGKTDIVCKA